MTIPEANVSTVAAIGALTVGALLTVPSIISWRRLAQIYSDQPIQVEASFRSVSGKLEGTYIEWNGMFRLDVGTSGLRIAQWRPLQCLLPTLFIPWSAINRCEGAHYYFSPLGLKLEIARWSAPFYHFSSLGHNERLVESIQQRWGQNRNEAPTADGGQN